MILPVAEPATFVHHSRLRMGSTDAAGIWYFTSALEVAHEAWEAWLESRGVPLQQVIAAGAFIMPIVHAEADYQSPARLGDELRVSLQLAELTERSMVISSQISSPTGIQLASTRVVHACVRGGAAVPWPAAFRAALTSPAG